MVGWVSGWLVFVWSIGTLTLGAPDFLPSCYISRLTPFFAVFGCFSCPVLEQNKKNTPKNGVFDKTGHSVILQKHGTYGVLVTSPDRC